MYKRVLLKLSGEALSGEGKIFNPEVLAELAQTIKEVHDMGVEIAIVVGGGNFIRGKFAEELQMDRVQVDNMGMLATVINALAVQNALERAGVPTRVQTAIDMPKIAEPYIQRRAIRHLEKGRIVIFGAGTGNPFFSTDTCAALRSSEIKAEVILAAKNGVDGVYSADPKKDPTAFKYDRLTHMDLIEKNLQVMDTTAMAMCRDNGVDLLVFNMNDMENIKRAALGEPIGTVISSRR